MSALAHRARSTLKALPAAPASLLPVLVPALAVLPGALLWIVLEPTSADLTAQLYRAELWERHGFVLWNTEWYGGILNPGYSLLFPPLGALLGVRAAGLFATLACALLLSAIAHRLEGRRAAWGAAWLALGCTTFLYTGRLTFALGMAVAAAALLVALRGSRVGAGALALLSVAAAPLAGLFLALAGAAWWLGSPGVAVGRPSSWRQGAAPAGWLVGGSLAGLVALALVFPQGGAHPFSLSSYVAVPLGCAMLLALVPRELRVLRIATVLYLALATAALVVGNPVGGNSVRLGALVGGPALAIAVAGRRLGHGQGARTLVLAVAVAGFLYWQWVAAVRDYADSRADPALEAAFHAPLIEELERRSRGEPLRVHVLPTRNRGEARHVAPSFDLARGWLRQSESDDEALLADGTLTAAGHREWLERHGVAYVAVPEAELHVPVRREAELLASGPPHVREVWRTAGWALYELTGDQPGLIDGGARIVAVEPDRVELELPGPGSYLLRVGWTPYWAVTAGSVCVRGEGEWTRVEAGGPGRVELRARLSLDGLLRRGEAGDC